MCPLVYLALFILGIALATIGYQEYFFSKSTNKILRIVGGILIGFNLVDTFKYFFY